MNFDEMSFKINDSTGVGIRSVHRGIANAGFADGSVHQLSEKIDPEVLKSLITVDGGEDVRWLDDGEGVSQPTLPPNNPGL